MKLSKVRILGVSMLMLSAMVMSVFAYEYITSQQISTGIVVLAPTVEIGVYWDSEGTQPVTAIDFGSIYQPNQVEVLWIYMLHVKNEGTVATRVYWNSTLSSVTDMIVDELYRYNGGYSVYNNGTLFDVDEVKIMAYKLTISAYPPISTYNWTLTIWGEY